MATRLSFSCFLYIKQLVISSMQTNGEEGLWLHAGGREGLGLGLEHGLIAVMHLSVVYPIPPIPGFGGGIDMSYWNKPPYLGHNPTCVYHPLTNTPYLPVVHSV